MDLFGRFRKKIIPNTDKQIPSGDMPTASSGNSGQDKIALLTPREHDLFLLLLEGHTLEASANQLSIKYSTANTHMTSIYRKLNVNSRAQLIINYRQSNK